MQVIYKSVLAFKNCQTVFRSHSSGALPVLAITGFRFCCKTNRKPLVFGPMGVQKQVIFLTTFGVPFWVTLGVHFGSLLGSILGHFGVPFLVTLGATDGHHLKPPERHRELLWSSSGNLWGSFPGSSLGLLWVLL